MLIKRPIYNQKLKCSAYEVLTQELNEQTEVLAQQLITMISSDNTQLPIFLPYSLKSLLEQLDEPLINPVIFTVHAKDLESKYSPEDLKDSACSIALLVDEPQQLNWFNIAEYIGLTEKILDNPELGKIVKLCKKNQRKIIAYGIKTPQSFDKCNAFFIDFYCGEFIFEPNIDQNTAIASNELNFLELLCLLQEETCDYQAVTNLIQSDPVLSYQLLRLSNSAIFAGYKAIDSIEQAILRLGLLNLKNWAMLLSMQNISKKPMEVLESGLLRAHMASSLAGNEADCNKQRAYTAGLLSVLDSLLDRPISELLQSINLVDELKDALLKKQGSLGTLLKLVIAYEEGDWDFIESLDYNGQDLSKVYIECLEVVSKERQALQSS